MQTAQDLAALRRSLYYALGNSGSCWIKDEDQKYQGEGIINYNGFSTLKDVAILETFIAESIMHMIYVSSVAQIDKKVVDDLIDEFEVNKNEGRHLHIHQRDAVHMVVNNSFSVLTGGPGTGKTTVLNAIAYVLRQLNPSIRINYTAPTGKAARRINESTGEDACTLHKKLNIGYGNDPTAFADDCLFVDECSMLDLKLMTSLIKSISTTQRLVLVGDENQLPSVGIGTILRDLLKAKKVPYTKLTKTFRQDNSSMLFQNISNVRDGICELVEGSDFEPIQISDNENMNQIAKLLLSRYLEAVKEYGIENTVLLLPYRAINKKVIASETMNNVIHLAIKNGEQGLSSTITEKNGMKQTRVFCKGDYVMQLENRTECANGEVGCIEEINFNEGTILVNFGEREIVKGSPKMEIKVSYTQDELEQLTLAYSMTVHKSQGSEYPCVIMCMLNEHGCMLNRNIFYTGITRAKKKCIVIYQQNALEKAVSTLADENRYSFLAEKLIYLSNQYEAARIVG